MSNSTTPKQLTPRSSQTTLVHQGSTSTPRNDATASSSASEPSKTEMKVSDLRKHLPDIKQAGNVHKGLLCPAAAHLIADGRLDKRRLILFRFTKPQSGTTRPQDQGFWKKFDKRMYEIVHNGFYTECNKLKKAVRLRDLVKDAKSDPKDLNAVRAEDKAGQDTDVIVICLEGFWDMIVRTIKPPKKASPDWESSDKGKLLQFAKTQIAKTQLESQGQESQSIDFFAIAKWSAGPQVNRHPGGDWLMTIVQDKLGLLRSRV